MDSEKEKALQDRFTQIYNRYKGPIYKMCLVKLKDESIAEDCMQNAFIVLYKKMLNGEEIKNPRAFLYKTAGNFVLKSFDERAKQLDRTVSITDYEDRLIDEQNRIDNNIDYELLNKQLNALLTPDEQRLLKLKYIDDLTIEEAAKALDISKAAVAKRLQRLREKIKKAIIL